MGAEVCRRDTRRRDEAATSLTTIVAAGTSSPKRLRKGQPVLARTSAVSTSRSPALTFTSFRTAGVARSGTVQARVADAGAACRVRFCKAARDDPPVDGGGAPTGGAPGAKVGAKMLLRLDAGLSGSERREGVFVPRFAHARPRGTMIAAANLATSTTSRTFSPSHWTCASESSVYTSSGEDASCPHAELALQLRRPDQGV